MTCQLDGVCDGQLVLTSYLFPGCFVQASIQSADGSSSTSEADLASAKRPVAVLPESCGILAALCRQQSTFAHLSLLKPVGRQDCPRPKRQIIGLVVFQAYWVLSSTLGLVFTLDCLVDDSD